MADNQLQVILDEQGVAKENARQLLEAFGAPFTEAGEILAEYETIVVKDEEDFETMAVARSKRLKLKEIRVGVEKKRKELKEDSLRTGRAIDSVAKFVKENIEPAEEHLELQEKFAEIKQAERAAKVKAARVEQLMAYTDDISLYNLDGMAEDQFDTLVSSLKAQKEAAARAAKEAEEARIAAEKAERERQAAIEAENAKLKADAEKREAEMATERAKAQAEADKKIEAERAAAEAERQKREALEAQQREREEAEAKAKEAAEDAKRQELLAPDKEKLISFAKGLDVVRIERLPAVKTAQAQKIVNKVEVELTKLSNLIIDEAKGL